jgi:hypothetical protein
VLSHSNYCTCFYYPFKIMPRSLWHGRITYTATMVGTSQGAIGCSRPCMACPTRRLTLCHGSGGVVAALLPPVGWLSVCTATSSQLTHRQQVILGYFLEFCSSGDACGWCRRTGMMFHMPHITLCDGQKTEQTGQVTTVAPCRGPAKLPSINQLYYYYSR